MERLIKTNCIKIYTNPFGIVSDTNGNLYVTAPLIIEYIDILVLGTFVDSSFSICFYLLNLIKGIIINKYSWMLRHSISAIDHAFLDGAV